MSNLFSTLVAVAVLLPTGLVASSDPPSVEIKNKLIRAKIYPPDKQKGYYRGTRFDWSGVLYSLVAAGHDYYGTWFDQTERDVHDFIYRDDKIVAGPCSAVTGPVDEFAPIGYEDAKPGGTFIKMGVGALTKPSGDKYDNYHLYEIANAGEWRVIKHTDSVEFVHTLQDSKSGYGYRYRKDVRLPADKSQMVMEHHLKNTGKRAISTTVYNHNFLVLDRRAPGPGLTISVPFAIRNSSLDHGDLADVRGHEIVYAKTLQDRDVFYMHLEGFGQAADDNAIQIENKSVGAGLRWRTDRPLLRESLWSIRTVVAMEPFISIAVPPGADFTWNTVYDYYALPPNSNLRAHVDSAGREAGFSSSTRRLSAR